MSPIDRLKKCFELTEFLKQMNKNYNLELKKKLKDNFILE